MGDKRTLETFSAAKGNLDAQLVLAELKQIPRRQRSATLWHWAASHLRGQPRQMADGGAGLDAEALAAIDSALDNL